MLRIFITYLLSLPLPLEGVDIFQNVHEQKIQMGIECCYSDQYIEKVQNKINTPQIDYYSLNVKLEGLEYSERGNGASKWHWYTFWALQVLDVYSTDKGLQYNCVVEKNPFLPKVPTVGRVIAHKTVVLSPMVITNKNIRSFTDIELLPATIITGLVVANNYRVISNAKRYTSQNQCAKIR